MSIRVIPRSRLNDNYVPWYFFYHWSYSFASVRLSTRNYATKETLSVSDLTANVLANYKPGLDQA